MGNRVVASLRPGELFAGDFRVESALSEGGMGAVYVAEQLSTGRQRALKLMLPQLVSDARLRERFEQEARIGSKIHSEHVVEVVAAGVDAESGTPWLAMEYLRGLDLDALVRRDGVLSPTTTLEIARQMAHAIGAAHAAGIVHRDLKPENVFVADSKRTGAKFTIKVLDFGIAKVVAELDKALTGAVGSPMWMAPEQTERGGAIGPQTDVWAIGLIVFHMLTGRYFWRAAEDQATMAQLMRELVLDAVPSATARASELGLSHLVPAGFDAWLARSLARSPSSRFPNATAQYDALEIVLDQGTVSLAATLSGAAQLPAITATASSNTNLRKPRSRFIGRARELAACGDLMRDTRLVTITGVGGNGKTRLALALAQEALPKRAGGVWFVDLAPIQDGERVALALATAMGIREQPGTNLIDTVCARVANAQVLFVFDNCEHVLSSAAYAVSRLLDSGDEVRVLATSREQLGLDGERTYTLREMTLPEAGASKETIASSDAVLLFLERASVHAEVALEELPIVADVCRRLDGIPLAIELAAARVKVLGVADIARKLDDRFRLLTGGNKDGLARHQTLQATMEWSYELLSSRDRALLRQTSLFAGGWTLESAMRVCDEADDMAVLDGLGRLVDKSLVIARRQNRSTRYFMLETVRQFGQAKLASEGEATSATVRFIELTIDLAKAFKANLRGPDSREWIERMDVERENLLAAHRACDAVPQGAQLGVALLACLGLYLQVSALFDLGLGLTEHALARTTAPDMTVDRAEVLARAAWCAHHTGKYELALDHAKRAVDMCRALGDQDKLGWTLGCLGAVHATMGHMEEARLHLEAALVIVRAGAEPVTLPETLNNLAQLLYAMGDFEPACARLEEARSLATSARSRCLVLLNLSAVHVQRAAFADARATIAEVLPLFRSGSGTDRSARVDLVEVAAKLAAATNASAIASRLFGAATAAREAMKLRMEPHEQSYYDVKVTLARAELGERFDSSFAEGKLLSLQDAIGEIETWMAN